MGGGSLGLPGGACPQGRGDVIALGGITSVTLSGIVSPSPTVSGPPLAFSNFKARNQGDHADVSGRITEASDDDQLGTPLPGHPRATAPPRQHLAVPACPGNEPTRAQPLD